MYGNGMRPLRADGKVDLCYFDWNNSDTDIAVADAPFGFVSGTGAYLRAGTNDAAPYVRPVVRMAVPNSCVIHISDRAWIERPSWDIPLVVESTVVPEVFGE